jgi:hypothetical protein
MTLERMIGMIESTGEYPCLRTETGAWSLRTAPGTSKEREAQLDFRIGEQAEVIGGVAAFWAREGRFFTVFSQCFPDGSQINLMQDYPAKESFV